MIEQSQKLQQQHYQRYNYQLANYISTQSQLSKQQEETQIIQYLKDHKSWEDQKIQFGDQNKENPHKFIRSLWNWSVTDQFLTDFSKLNKSQMYNKLYYMERLLSGNFNGFEKLEIEDSVFKNSQTKVGIQFLDIFYPNIVVIIGIQQIPVIRDSHVNLSLLKSKLYFILLQQTQKVIKFKFEWYILFQSIFDQQFQKTPNVDFLNILEDPLKFSYITDLSNFTNPLDMIRTSDQYQSRKEKLSNVYDFQKNNIFFTFAFYLKVERYLPKQIPDYYLTYQESIQYFNFGNGWEKKSDHLKIIQFKNKMRIQQMNQEYLQRMLSNEDLSQQIQKILDIYKIQTPLTQQQSQVITSYTNLIVMGRSGTGKTLCALYHLLALEVLYTLYLDKTKNNQTYLIDSLSEREIGLQSVFITASPILTRKIQKYYQKHKDYLRQAIINISNQRNDNDNLIHDQNTTLLLDSLISDFSVLQDESKVQDQNQSDAFDILELDDDQVFIENSGQNISQQLKNQSQIEFQQGHPSFYTVRSYLMSLECCLERPFFERDKQGNIIQYSSQNSLGKFQHQRLQLNLIYQQMDQIQEDDKINEQIFYQNHKLSTYEIYMREQFLQNKINKQSQENNFLQDQINRKFEIDYNYFASYFWPFASIKFKSSSFISCSSLWTEIYSVIKGSAYCYKYKQRFMPKDDYLKQNSTNLLTEQQKITIYSMFELYEKWKKNQSGYDILDLNNYILSELQEKRCNIPSIHFTVIDEVQDLPFSIIQLFTQINECNVFFSGDSTQNIARGVGFKFSDLKTLYEKIQPYKGQSEIQAHHLTINFRSHRSILQLSNSVIDLIYNLFPTTLDVMPRETSELEGIRPIVLVDADQNFLFNILKGQSENLDFGSNQAIIVRDEESKQKLPSILKHAICLTIFEAKGLEFEDVILYDFFTDSRCTFQQLNYCKQQTVTDEINQEQQQTQIKKHDLVNKIKNQKQLSKQDQNLKTLSLSEFNPVYNSILCSELKQLYTAITRPKKRLIIFDNQEYKRKPILDYWLQKNLVCLISPQDFKKYNQEKPTFEREQNEEKQKIIKDLQNQIHLNSQIDWFQQGMQMFQNKYYQQAIKCFEKIGQEKLIQQAKLHLELQTCSKDIQNIQNELQILKLNQGQYASLNQSSKNNLKYQFCKQLNQLKQNLRIIGDQFYQINQKNLAAQCYSNSEQYQLAGQIYEELQLYKEAAESYLFCNSLKAAQIYEKLNHLEKAIGILELLKNWKQIILLLSRNPQYKITDEKKRFYTQSCLQQIFQNKFNEIKMEQINQLFVQQSLEDSFTLFEFELDEVNLNQTNKDISFLEKQTNQTELQGSSDSFEELDLDFDIENDNFESEQLEKDIDLSQLTFIHDQESNSNLEKIQSKEEIQYDAQLIISLNSSFVSNPLSRQMLSEENKLFKQLNKIMIKQVQQILQLFMLVDNDFIQIVQESLNLALDQNQFKSKMDFVEFLLQKLNVSCLNKKIIHEMLSKMGQFQFQEQIWIFVIFLKQYEYIPTIIKQQIHQLFQKTENSNLVLSHYLKQNYLALAKKQEQQRQSIFLVQSMIDVLQSILKTQESDSQKISFSVEYLQEIVLLGFGELFVQFMSRDEMLNLYLLYGKHDQYFRCLSTDILANIQERQIQSDEDIQLAIIILEQQIYQIKENNFIRNTNLKQTKIIQSFYFNYQFQLLIQNNQKNQEQYQIFTGDLLKQLDILLKSQTQLNEIQIFDVVSAFFMAVKYFYQVGAFKLLQISQLTRIQIILEQMQNDLQFSLLVQDRRLKYMVKAMFAVFQVREIPDSQIFQVFGKQYVVLNFSNNLIHQIFKNKKQQPQIYFCDQNFEQVLVPIEVVSSAIFKNLDQISNELNLLTDIAALNQVPRNKTQNKIQEILDQSFYIDGKDEDEESQKLDQILSLINNSKSKKFDKDELVSQLQTIKLRQDNNFVKLFEGKNFVSEQEIQELICQDKFLLQYGLSRMYNQRQQMKGQTSTEHIIYNIVINNLANQNSKLIIPQKYVGYFYCLEKDQLLHRDIQNAIMIKQKNSDVILLNLNEYDNDFDFQLIAQFINKNKDKSYQFQKVYFTWILMIIANVYDLKNQTLNQFIKLIKSIQLEDKFHKILNQNKHYKQLLSATSVVEANDLAYELVTQKYFEELFGYWEDITVYNDLLMKTFNTELDIGQQNILTMMNS
ncbi:hypothetical protein ABPG74_012302 [Tetrahymena malaccensis]